jgi:hypothetical protein
MFTTNFVRDLNAKVATMGDGGRGCLSAALHRETVIRPLTEHPRLSAESIAEATYQLGLSRSILYKLLQRYELQRQAPQESQYVEVVSGSSDS